MYVVDNAIENFNTTYVTVSLAEQAEKKNEEEDFNTTYVTVSLSTVVEEKTIQF